MIILNYVLKDDIYPYYNDKLRIENPQIVDGSGNIIYTQGHVESSDSFISFYPDGDDFDNLNGNKEINIIYDVLNQHGDVCKSLLNISVTATTSNKPDPKVNSTLWNTIQSKNNCVTNLDITRIESNSNTTP